MQGFVLLHFSIYLSLSTSGFIFMVIVLIDTCNTYITKEGLTLPQVLHWLGFEFLNHCEGSINCSWKYRLIPSYVTVMKGKLSRFDFWYMGYGIYIYIYIWIYDWPESCFLRFESLVIQMKLIELNTTTQKQEKSKQCKVSGGTTLWPRMVPEPPWPKKKKFI